MRVIHFRQWKSVAHSRSCCLIFTSPEMDSEETSRMSNGERSRFLAHLHRLYHSRILLKNTATTMKLTTIITPTKLAVTITDVDQKPIPPDSDLGVGVAVAVGMEEVALAVGMEGVGLRVGI